MLIILIAAYSKWLCIHKFFIFSLAFRDLILVLIICLCIWDAHKMNFHLIPHGFPFETRSFREPKQYFTLLGVKIIFETIAHNCFLSLFLFFLLSRYWLIRRKLLKFAFYSRFLIAIFNFISCFLTRLSIQMLLPYTRLTQLIIINVVFHFK